MSTVSFSSSHPPFPPIVEEDIFPRLRLLRSRRVGIQTYYRLIAEHGSAQAALAALPEIAREAGDTHYQVCPEGVIVAELKAARRVGAVPLAPGEEGYPAALTTISDAPPILWRRGSGLTPGLRRIAIVGARNASSLGTRMARKLAGDLSEAGFAIVSGLARGIDTVAHAASAGRGTAAVLAGGCDVIYPVENADLAARVLETGEIWSEQPMGLSPQARHFPRRNRLISGMAEAVIVVEAAAKSGTLITAQTALDQGRDVLAVPGHPFDARATGCNNLIRDGATLVRGADDVLAALSGTGEAQQILPLAQSAPSTRPPGRRGSRSAIPATARPAHTAPPARSLADTAALHRAILDRLGPSPMAEDQLIRDLGADAGALAPALMDLELDGRIERGRGGLLSLAQGT
ncbi:MAG: DNA-processing protein DprA [Pseudomonadota bacterium]